MERIYLQFNWIVWASYVHRFTTVIIIIGFMFDWRARIYWIVWFTIYLVRWRSMLTLLVLHGIHFSFSLQLIFFFRNKIPVAKNNAEIDHKQKIYDVIMLTYIYMSNNWTNKQSHLLFQHWRFMAISRQIND